MCNKIMIKCPVCGAIAILCMQDLSPLGNGIASSCGVADVCFLKNVDIWAALTEISRGDHICYD